MQWKKASWFLSVSVSIRHKWWNLDIISSRSPALGHKNTYFSHPLQILLLWHWLKQHIKSGKLKRLQLPQFSSREIMTSIAVGLWFRLSLLNLPLSRGQYFWKFRLSSQAFKVSWVPHFLKVGRQLNWRWTNGQST